MAPSEAEQSALVRRRRTPMWGCVRGLFIAGLVVLAILLVSVFFYIGTERFARLIQAKIVENLASHLNRKVFIGKVTLIRGLQTRVIVDDLRIANAPGALTPYFATVRQVEIVGGIDSFLQRRIKVGRIDIRDPHVDFEVFPEGAPLTHNFPSWKPSPPSKGEIVRLDVSKMFIKNLAFDFNDRRHQIVVNIAGLSSEVTPTARLQNYAGLAESPSVTVRIQDYLPFQVALRGGFLYVPGKLELKSIALRGQGIETFVAGKLDPLTEGVYNLDIASHIDLHRVRQIFRVDKTLQGLVAFNGKLGGRGGDFKLDADLRVPQLKADAYDLADVRGHMVTTGEKTVADIKSARYGGGTIGAHYLLANYSEPYPMHVDLRYDHISLEKLFADWTVENSGLRGAATGQLHYDWEKDRILQGSGVGHAALSRSSLSFGNPHYAVPIAGATDFTLRRGVIGFQKGSLDTSTSHVDFAGSLRIDDLYAKLKYQIHSSDLTDLDQLAFNLAHSLGKKNYTVLGLGGSATASGTIEGRFKDPLVMASIEGQHVRYNQVDLGDAALGLRYDGKTSRLNFERGQFNFDGGRLEITGTLDFPDRGPSPEFNLNLSADGYPVKRALDAINLQLGLDGRGTGNLVVRGTPDRGNVSFANFVVTRDKSKLRLNGLIAWLPGKGNVEFNLDVGADAVDVQEIITFLDLGKIPATGAVTGTLHLDGTKAKLEGAGAVSLRNGSLYGEPIDVATADLLFTQGSLKASNVEVHAPAGVLKGEANLDSAGERFSYILQPTTIDISKLKTVGALSKFFGGTISISSSGAGTLTSPEIVLEASLDKGTITGVQLPAGSPPPKIYVAIRNGQLVVKGSAAGVLSIDGTGAVAPDGSLSGNVQVAIIDIAQFLAIFAPGSEFPASGNLTADLSLGGNINSLDTVEILGSVPVLQLHVAGNELTVPRPIQFSFRKGRVSFDSFEVGLAGSNFSIAGYAGLTGDRSINLTVKGLVEAAFIQFFTKDIKAEGHVNVAASVTGTLDDPRVNGEAEVQNAQLRIAGFPQVIDNITGTLIFEGDRVEIDSLKASLGGGRVIAGGFIALAGLTPKAVRLNIQGQEVSLRYFAGVTVDGDFSLVLSGDPSEHMVLQGDVKVSRALYFKDFDFGTSILNLVLERRGLLPAVAASWQDRVALRVHLNAPDTLAIKDNIASVTASADLDVNGTLANPVVLGVVTVDEGGKVRFQDIDYRVTRGTINFQNPLRIDPYFDVTVEGRMQDVQLTVNVTGTLDKINTNITTDPPVSDLTLLSLIGPGQFGPSSTGRAAAASVASLRSAGSSLLIQSLGGLIGSKILPFADSFRLDVVESSGSKSGSQTQATFEKRISNNVRAVVIYNLNSDKNVEIVEWQVTPDWILQLTRDSEQGPAYIFNAVDARFRRQYEGHWWQPVDRVRKVKAGTTLLTDSTITSEANSEKKSEAGKQTAAAKEASSTVGSIGAIRFETDSPYDTSKLGDLIDVKSGKPLLIRDVQGSIKSLYATGDFRDIRVEETPRGLDRDLTFGLSLNYRIESVHFEGFKSKRGGGRSDVLLKRGDVLSLNAVDRSAVALQESLARRGYFEATVDPETKFFRETNRVDVTFHVSEGPHAKIAGIDLEGNLEPYTTAEVLKPVQKRIGQSFKLDESRNNVESITRSLVRKGRRKADIRSGGETYDKATQSVRLRYKVVVGPIVKVEVAGVPKREVRRLIPFRRSEPYSEDVIARTTDRLLQTYQQRGYFFASIDPLEKTVGDEFVITFNIKPGKRYEVAGVEFQGNQQVSDKKLRKVIATGPIGGIKKVVSSLLRRPQGVTQEQLNTDRDAVGTLYQLQGFTLAKVDQPIAKEIAPGRLQIIFPINEGVQTIVTKIAFEGNEQVETKDLPKAILKPGSPLNPQDLATDLLRLRTFYFDRGNAEVQIVPRTDLSPDRRQVTLTYRIAEGPKVDIHDVVVRGNIYTHSNVILRKTHLRKGQPFTFRALLEAQQELYRLGIFQRVEVNEEKTGTTTAQRDVAIQVEEGRALSLAGAIGYSTDQGARTTVSVSHRNLFGTARFLGFEALVAQREDRFFLTYREPFVGPLDIPVQLTIFQSDQRRLAEFDIKRRGLFVEASRVVHERSRWSLHYEYRVVNVDCLDSKGNKKTCEAVAGQVPGLERQDQSIQISSLTPTVFWDKRDDAINPHKGFLASTSLEYAFPLASARASFLKSFSQGSWYRPITDRSVFAVSGRLGLIQPISGGSGLNAVPFSERFTAGGETSHRGFPLDRLGILGEPDAAGVFGPATSIVRNGSPGAGPNDVIVIGGNGLVLINLEYRFPILGSLNGAVFLDAGNVWGDLKSIRFGDFRYGPGVGIRYITPLGPVRFDLGFNPNAKPYEDKVVPFLTLGYAF
ncbi:MAG TPA: outer membrane protein assembly factor BamA [Thermoanaerobaculia bacterium]|nr:outer membrane protein assembly factor BamA [Thermoanaerobaculia bacterium]